MRSFWGLVVQDVYRIAMRRRVWLLLAAFIAIGLAWMIVERSAIYALPSGRMSPTGPMLAVGAIDSLVGLLLFAPLLLGGTLAEDRSTGLSRLLLARCGSRTAWVTSKLVAMLVVSLVLFVLSGVLFAGAAALLAGWDPALLAETIGVKTRLAAHPFGMLAVSCVLLALATTATASLSSVTAFFVRSPAVSLLVPVIVLFAAAVGAPAKISPYIRADFLGTFFEWNTLPSVIAYWSVFLAASWGASVVLSWFREE